MSKHHDADLILKLYELRREETLRKARDWYFLSFNPKSVADFADAMMGEHSGYLRMVLSYWDMAAALVNSGAISLDLFTSTNNEYIGVFSKVELLLPEIRGTFGPNVAIHLEKLIDQIPDGRKQVAAMRERMEAIRAQVASRQAKAAQS